MFGFLLRRLVYTLPIMLGVALVCFALVHLSPGDPLVSILPPDASQELQAQLIELYGFNRSYPEQFASWVWRALHGDLGTSIATRRPVLDDIAQFAPAPIELATGAKPYYIGKPNPLMMRNASAKLGVRHDETAIIGDRMDTDMIAGIESDMTTVLVLSGVTSLADIGNFAYRSDYVFDNVGGLLEGASA